MPLPGLHLTFYYHFLTTTLTLILSLSFLTRTLDLDRFSLCPLRVSSSETLRRAIAIILGVVINWLWRHPVTSFRLRCFDLSGQMSVSECQPFLIVRSSR
ncbi:hypothetical protein R3P38DRAFT_1870334 [Favolaschia claudopus]|uniref:Secreted protein n=1 Tax=Favolaschia claudopus TaxID=2862362 RepID=A0AAW0DCG0_9AGAR